MLEKNEHMNKYEIKICISKIWLSMFIGYINSASQYKWNMNNILGKWQLLDEVIVISKVIKWTWSIKLRQKLDPVKN